MISEKLLKNTIISGIFLIPFTSLIVVSSFFFPYITPKNLAFRLIILIIAAVYAVLIYAGKRYRTSFGTVGWAFTAFMVIILLADIFGQYSHKSFFSNFERMEGYFTFVFLFFYFIVLTGVMKTERLWENLLNTSLASSVLMAIYALVEKSSGVDRLAAQLGNSTYLGAFMLFNIFFAFFLIIRRLDRGEGKTGNKWMAIGAYIIILLIDLYVFYYTGTRGALLGLFTGLVFAAIMFSFFEKHNRKLKIAGYTILILIIISVGTLFSIRNTAYVKDSVTLSRFSALIASPTDLTQYAETQGGARLAIWKIALQGVKERPILGWGQENFNYVFNKYYDPKIYDQEQWFDRAHNVFFDWLVAGGVIGLLSYLSIFAFAVIALWRKKREDATHHFTFADKTVLTALLIAYFIHNFFVFDSISSYILFVTILGYISIHERQIMIPAKWKPAFLQKDGTLALGVTIFVLLSLIGLYYLVISPYIASTNLIKAISYQNSALNPNLAFTADQRNDLLKKSLGFYNSAYAYGITGTAEVDEQILQGGTSVIEAQGIADDIKTAYSTLIDSKLKEQLASAPEDARYFLFYAIYLAQVGRFDESLPYFKKAEALSPTKQSILLPEASAYINDKKYQDSLPIFQKAFELDENNTEARILYAVGLIYAGDDATAETILAPIRDTDQGTDIRLMRAYYDTKQPGKITELLNIKLAIASKLAAAGDKAEAIKEIQDVISINPAYTAAGQAKIAAIQNSK